jgi:selenoprotein W-related protein
MPGSRVEITYCTKCRFLLRASWMAQEILATLGDELGEVALIPGGGGIFEVTLNGEVVGTNRDGAPMPDPATVKRAIRDQAAPDRKIGHK